MNSAIVTEKVQKMYFTLSEWPVLCFLKISQKTLDFPWTWSETPDQGSHVHQFSTKLYDHLVSYPTEAGVPDSEKKWGKGCRHWK